MIVGIAITARHVSIGCLETTGPRLFPNLSGDYVTPAAVAVDEHGRVLVGQDAQTQIRLHPELGSAHFKGWLGTLREIRLGPHVFRSEQLMALLLRELMNDAERRLGTIPEAAILTVSTYFSMPQRHALQIACEMTGVRVERLLSEPVAAALAYDLLPVGQISTCLVVDFSDSFCVTTLRQEAQQLLVHAHACDPWLNDEVVNKLFVTAFLRELRIDTATLEADALKSLHAQLDRCIEALASQHETQLELPLGGAIVRWELDREHFAMLCAPLVNRLATQFEQALKTNDYDAVVLIGHAARLPGLARRLASLTGRMPLRHLAPEQVLTLGACKLAARLADTPLLTESLRTDVCPWTLGVAIDRDEQGVRQCGLYDPIVPRQVPAPLSRERTYPLPAGQSSIGLSIFQGENPLVMNNIKLGEVTVPLASPPHINNNAIAIRISYDTSGLLQAEFTLSATGDKYQLLLEQLPGTLDPIERETRLEALNQLKTHPREETRHRDLLIRAERLYERSLPVRTELQNWLVKFRAVLESQDQQQIEAQRKAFEQALDAMEKA